MLAQPSLILVLVPLQAQLLRIAAGSSRLLLVSQPCEFFRFKHVTNCTPPKHWHLYNNTVSSLLLSSLLFVFSSSAYPQTDTAQLYNTHPDSCTHVDRTGLEFNLSSVSLQNENSSHYPLDIIHGGGASPLRLPPVY